MAVGSGLTVGDFYKTDEQTPPQGTKYGSRGLGAWGWRLVISLVKIIHRGARTYDHQVKSPDLPKKVDRWLFGLVVRIVATLMLLAQ